MVFEAVRRLNQQMYKPGQSHLQTALLTGITPDRIMGSSAIMTAITIVQRTKRCEPDDGTNKHFCRLKTAHMWPCEPAG